MEKKQLQESLSDLHRSLADVGDLDEATREAMRVLTDDLNRVLAQTSTDPEEIQTLRDQLHDLLLKFETEHPQITGILGRLASSLANLGI